MKNATEELNEIIAEFEQVAADLKKANEIIRQALEPEEKDEEDED